MIANLGIAAIVTLLASMPAAAQPASARVDYDTFMQMDVQGRIRTFNGVTPENRAELVRTQIERWLDQNRARLNAKQIEILEENIAFITADLYRPPLSAEKRDQAKALEVRTASLLEPSDMREALTIHGPYIPKQAAPPRK